MNEVRPITTRRLLSLSLAGAVLLAAQPARAQAPKAPMRDYDSPYYAIHTDLDPNAVPEIAVTCVEYSYNRSFVFGIYATFCVGTTDNGPAFCSSFCGCHCFHS